MHLQAGFVWWINKCVLMLLLSWILGRKSGIYSWQYFYYHSLGRVLLICVICHFGGPGKETILCCRNYLFEYCVGFGQENYFHFCCAKCNIISGIKLHIFHSLNFDLKPQCKTVIKNTQNSESTLAHYDLVMLVISWSDIHQGHHWLRYWLVAWWHQAITWTNVD